MELTCSKCGCEVEEIDCPDCHGDGIERCEDCCGEGWIECYACGQDYECDECGGRGEWKCETCDGTGLVTPDHWPTCGREGPTILQVS